MENAKWGSEKKTHGSGLSPEPKEGFLRKVTDKLKIIWIHHNS